VNVSAALNLYSAVSDLDMKIYHLDHLKPLRP